MWYSSLDNVWLGATTTESPEMKIRTLTFENNFQENWKNETFLTFIRDECIFFGIYKSFVTNDLFMEEKEQKIGPSEVIWIFKSDLIDKGADTIRSVYFFTSLMNFQTKRFLDWNEYSSHGVMKHSRHSTLLILLPDWF